MEIKKNNTNYVIVVDYEEGQTLEDCYLLGWSSKYDWFDCDTCGDEILTPTGKVKKNEFGILQINRNVGVYIGEFIENIVDHYTSSLSEGIDSVICKLENKDNVWNLVPVR